MAAVSVSAAVSRSSETEQLTRPVYIQLVFLCMAAAYQSGLLRVYLNSVY